jgi:hypothetical protein
MRLGEARLRLLSGPRRFNVQKMQRLLQAHALVNAPCRWSLLLSEASCALHHTSQPFLSVGPLSINTRL